MSEEQFWQIIALMRFNSSDALVAGIESAEDILAEKLHAIDTREHCRHCYRSELDPDNGDHYISADDFLYSRCVVVARGRLFYEVVLQRPSRMPRGVQFEDLLFLAAHAYERKTGEDFDHISPVTWESFSNDSGWQATPKTRGGKYTGANVPPGNRRPT
jgi:hypothetical protein